MAETELGMKKEKKKGVLNLNKRMKYKLLGYISFLFIISIAKNMWK